MARRGLVIARALSRVLGFGVLGLIALVLGAYALVCHTAAGRDWVSALAVEQGNALLRGRIELRELGRLGIFGATLHGITARDPSGQRVLAIESLALELSPSALLSGEIAIARIAVNGAHIELSDTSAERGVIAAFSPREAAQEPEPAAESEPPRVSVRSIELDGVSVTTDVPDFGRAGVADLHARARFDLHGAARAELHALRAMLVRDDETIGAIEAARGSWAETGDSSTIALRARVARSAIALDARARMPDDPEFATSPVKLSLVVDAVDAELLTALAQPALAAQLKAPVRVALTAGGTPDALDARLDLVSRAGAVQVEAELADRDRLELAVHSDGVTPAELWAQAPNQRIALELEASLGVAQAPARMPFEVRVTSAALDGEPLPTLRASGRIEAERVRGLELRAQGYGVALELRGDAGAEHLDLRGKLHARNFGAAGFSARALDATFEAEGPPSQLVTAVAVRGRELRYGDTLVTRVALDARGGPARYALSLDTQSDSPAAELQLEAAVLRGPRAVEIDASGNGTLLRRPFSLRVQEARVGYAGAIEVKRAVVQALGQRVALSGRYGGTPRDRLVATAHADLPALSRALALDPALRGEADLNLEARGTVARPSATLHVSARGVALPERPRFDAVADVELDTREGEMRVVAKVDSGRDLAVTTQLAAHFESRGRRPWQEALRAAQLEGTLALGAISTEWIEAWLPEPLPVRGAIAAEAELHGTLDQPELTASVRAKLRHPEQARAIEVALGAQYAQAAASATLAVLDAQGTWIEGRFALAHPAAGIEEFLAPGAALLHEGEWQAALRVDARPLGGLPVNLGLAPDLAPIRVGLELSAEHAARAEPSAQASIDILRPARAAAVDAQCGEQALELAVRAGLESGRADVRISGKSEAQQLFQASGGAAVRVSPLLSGTGAPVASGAGVTVELARLEVETLPLLCGVARGRLTGTLRASELLGKGPVLHAELAGEQISMGAREGIDFVLRARAADPEATLQASLRHGGTHSTLSARIPLRFGGSAVELVQDQPFSARARIDRLPIVMLLPRSFAISQASGHVSGAIDASGSLADPRVRGHLAPHAVALTVTGLAQPLHGIEGRIAFTDRRVAVERLVARDRGGSLVVRGAAELSKANEVTAKLEIEADEFPLRQQGQVAGELDARIGVAAQLSAEKHRVQVQLEDASAWVRGGDLRKGISLEPHPDIIDPRMQRVAAPEPAAPAIPLEITLDANDSFWIRRDDFAVKLSTHLEIQLDADGTRVRGPLRIHRGYLQLFGETFDIDGKSSVEFDGGSPPDPVLAITAGTVNRRTSERIDVRIAGRASAPALTFFIDEREVTAGDAAMAIFGRSDDGGSDAEGQAKSFVAGMMAGVMAMSARRELGDAMPILMLEPQDDLGSTRVRAGFELDSLVPGFLENAIRGVYVEGIFAGSGEQSTSTGVQGGVLIELYLPSDFLTSGQYGPGETWSLDLGWEP